MVVTCIRQEQENVFSDKSSGKIEHQDLAFFHGVNVDMTRHLSGAHRLGAEDIAASQVIDDDLVPVFVDQIFFQLPVSRMPEQPEESPSAAMDASCG